MLNPLEFDQINWQEIEEKGTILLSFPEFYSSSGSSVKAIVKRAVLSHLDQFEIVTITSEDIEIRNLYSSNGQMIILKE